MTEQPYSYKLIARSDFSAFWALFTDNLINLMVLAGVCQFVFNMPADVVYGRIVPGAAVAIIAGVVVYVLMARHVANKTGKDMVDEEVTSSPAAFPTSDQVSQMYTVSVKPPKVERLQTRTWTNFKAGN